MIFALTIEIKEDFQLLIILVKNSFHISLLDEFINILSLLRLIFDLIFIFLKVSKHLLRHLVMKFVLSLLIIYFSLSELVLSFLWLFKLISQCLLLFSEELFIFLDLLLYLFLILFLVFFFLSFHFFYCVYLLLLSLLLVFLNSFS